MIEMTTLGTFVKNHGGFIQTGPFGSQLHASDYEPQGIPVIMPANISDGKIRFDDDIARISPSTADTLKKHLCGTGDILYSRRGDITQRALIRETHEQVFCGTGCLRVNLGSADYLWAQFVSYQLGLPSTHEWLRQHAVGATMLNLNTKILSDVPLELPPLENAGRIVNLLRALDDKMEANNKLAFQLSELADAHFVDVSSKRTALVPLSDLVSTQYGITTSAAENGNFHLLRVTDINKRPWVDFNAVPYCQVDEKDVSKYETHPGDILVARMADPGKAALIEEASAPSVFASYLVRLTPHDSSLSHYIYYYLRSRPYQAYASAVGDGSVQRNMNAKVIVAVEIPIPAAKEIERFTSEVKELHRLRTAVLNENQKLTELRDYLLPRLMSGKITVRDAKSLL